MCHLQVGHLIVNACSAGRAGLMPVAAPYVLGMLEHRDSSALAYGLCTADMDWPAFFAPYGPACVFTPIYGSVCILTPSLWTGLLPYTLWTGLHLDTMYADWPAYRQVARWTDA